MSTEHRIGLNTNVSQGMGEFSRSTQDGRREAGEADRRAFDQAMSSDRERVAGQAEGPSNPARAALPSPFGLLGGQSVPHAATGALPDSVGAGLAEAANRLMVSDGSNGRRAVRVELKDDILPGVAVSVFEQEGRIVAAFACADEASRDRLCRASQGLADELAASLARPARVRISSDDPDDPRLHEVTGEPV